MFSEFGEIVLEGWSLVFQFTIANGTKNYFLYPIVFFNIHRVIAFF